MKTRNRVYYLGVTMALISLYIRNPVISGLLLSLGFVMSLTGYVK